MPFVEIAIAIVLALTGLLCVVLTVVGLPGIWLLILGALAIEYFEPTLLSCWTIGGVLGVAIVGEIIEFIAGSYGAAKSGGGWRAAVGAMIGTLVGAVLGTPLIPPLGTILGAIAGAGLGAIILEATRKDRDFTALKNIGTGAMYGRTIAIIVKGACTTTAAIWLSLAALL